MYAVTNAYNAKTILESLGATFIYKTRTFMLSDESYAILRERDKDRYYGMKGNRAIANCKFEHITDAVAA